MKMKNRVMGRYSQEIASLHPHEVESFLEKGRRWNLSLLLSKGGSVIFPHTLMHTCGDYIAAVVQGCLDSGASRVIVLGVLHSFYKPQILQARERARAGGDISNETCWGIFGPHFPGDETWKDEYSLENFSFLWNYEIKRRGI